MGCVESHQQQTKLKHTLLDNPIKIGGIQLKKRMAMGPMTRCRGDQDTGVPSDLMKEYYTQRADFGFILTECSPISPMSNAFPGAGGIFTEEQVEGWKKIVDSLHEQGCVIFLQMYHSGRATATEQLNGKSPIAPSAIPIEGDHWYTKKPHPVPKEMTKNDIQEVIQQFKHGAENARKAGFDGIELHAGNGYLVDQFLRDGSNKRTDEYGGSVENRCRFMLEIVDELIQVSGPHRVAIRFSPTGRYNDMYDSNPLLLMQHALNELNKRQMAFVELKRHGEIDDKKSQFGKCTDEKDRMIPSYQIPDFFKQLRPFYNGIIMGNDGFNPKTASEAIENKYVDIVSFSSLAIGNPDLPERIRHGYPLVTKKDYSTFYTGGPKGYTDQPPYKKKPLTKQVTDSVGVGVAKIKEATHKKKSEPQDLKKEGKEKIEDLKQEGKEQIEDLKQEGKEQIQDLKQEGKDQIEDLKQDAQQILDPQHPKQHEPIQQQVEQS